MNSQPTEIEATDAERDRAMIFAGGILLGHLATVLNSIDPDGVSMDVADLFVRDTLKSALASSTLERARNHYDQFYLEHCANLLANHTRELGVEPPTALDIISSVLGTAYTHVMQLDGIVTVGVVENLDDFRVPDEWLTKPE